MAISLGNCWMSDVGSCWLQSDMLLVFVLAMVSDMIWFERNVVMSLLEKESEICRSCVMFVSH